MKPIGRPAADQQSESIEFVPKRELHRAQRESERPRKQSEGIQKEIERPKRETERLRQELEAAFRARRRRAAPHSRGGPKPNPERPGRKPDRRYRQQACRLIPKRADERISVRVPERYPDCGGGWRRKARKHNIKERSSGGPSRAVLISPRDAAATAGGGVQERHPLQTSDAGGVGSVQLGPEALTLAAILNKQMGLSLGHTRQVLSCGFGLEVSRGGLYRVLARMAHRAAPTYDGLPRNRAASSR
jgi:hypothetical protein